jgi:hypothetical protein
MVSLTPIEQVTVGDFVWAWSDGSAAVVRRRVSRVFVRPSEAVLAVEYVAGRGAVDRVVATLEHPFRVVGKGWVAASRLVPGDVLQCIAPGDTVWVVRVLNDGRRVDVFNFEVEGEHTYFVGCEGVLVHNTSILQRATSRLRSSLFGAPSTPAPVAAPPAFAPHIGERLASRMEVPGVEAHPDYADASFTVTVPGFPGALVAGHVPSEGKVVIKHFFRRELPRGTGPVLLAKALHALDLQPAQELIFEPLANKPTLDAYRRGDSAADTELARSGRQALELLGLEAERFEFVRGKAGVALKVSVRPGGQAGADAR